MSIHKYQTAGGVRYKVKYYDDTHRSRTKGGFTTKREAQLWEGALRSAQNRGEYIDPKSSRVPLREVAQPWLTRQEVNTKPSTYRTTETAWRLHVEPRWGRISVGSVQPNSVADWLTELTQGNPRANPPIKPLGATAVRRCHGVLAGILDDAVNARRIASNPARGHGLKLPKKKRKPLVFLTHAQVHALAAASKHPEIVLTLAYTGLRWSELTGLQVKHVDLKRRRLTVERNLVVLPGGQIQDEGLKTGERRTVSFPRLLVPYLEQQCARKHRQDLVFTSEVGSVLRPPSSQRGWFPQAVRAAGIPRITPHDLRHTTASLAVQARANVKALQRMLGHASAAMTLDTYAVLFDDELDRVADALDADAEAALREAG